MSHARTQIRDAARALLADIGGVTHTAFRVENEKSLPALAVYADDELITAENRSGINTGVRYSRRMLLRVEYTALFDEAFEGASDAIALAVELRFAQDPSLSGLAVETLLEELQIEEEEREAEAPLGAMTLTFQVWYRTTALDPETTI